MARRTDRILVVEDDPVMREMLADFLHEDGYDVATAVDGRDALERALPARAVDLVLSDINMPNMKGFELLNAVRWRYPGTRRMLITAYNVEDYLELAMKHDVGNIFVKSSPFAFDELRATIRNLLTGDIFGMARYFAAGTPARSIVLRNGADLASGALSVMAMLPAEAQNRKLEVAVAEILTNAVYYGARRDSADDRASWPADFELAESAAVTVTVMADREKHGVAITDKGGRLSKQDVLFWLNRQASRDERGLPLGAFDTHGRGLFITRRFIDRLIINIDPAKKTEVIIINYLSNVYQGYKPLYINEL